MTQQLGLLAAAQTPKAAPPEASRHHAAQHAQRASADLGIQRHPAPQLDVVHTEQHLRGHGAFLLGGCTGCIQAGPWGGRPRLCIQGSAQYLRVRVRVEGPSMKVMVRGAGAG